MLKKIFTTVSMLLMLAALCAGAARASEDDVKYYVVKESDEFIDVLSEPGEAGEFRGSIWDDLCVAGLDETTPTDTGEKWIKIGYRRTGWVRAELLEPDQGVCKAAFETLKSLYEAIKVPDMEKWDDCANSTFIYQDTHNFDAWLLEHSLPEMTFTRNTSEGEVVSTTAPLEDALGDIANKFEFIGEYDAACEFMTEQSLYDSLSVYVGENEDEFGLTVTDIADKSESFYFTNATTEPRLSEVRSSYSWGG